MKQKKFKIEGTTLFVYRRNVRLNDAKATTTVSDPTSATTTTIGSVAIFQK